MNQYQLLNDSSIRIGQTTFKAWPNFQITGLRVDIPDRLFQLLYSQETIPLLWRARIPAPLLRQLCGFPNSELERLLHLSQLDPQKVEDWAKFCPALLILAADWDENDQLSPLEAIGNIRKGWQHTLREADWPSTKSTLRILRKISCFQCCPEDLDIIRHALKSPRKRNILQHLRRINSGVIDLLSLPEAFLSVSLLEQLSSMAAPPTNLSEVCLEVEALRSERGIFPTWPFQSGRLTHGILIRHRDELELSAANDLADSGVKLPPPPLGGIRAKCFQIEPITTIKGIFRESMVMENCAASYVRSVAHGSHYLYHLERPERATVLFTKIGDDWHPTQIKTPRNGQPKQETVDAVHIFAGTITLQLENDDCPF